MKRLFFLALACCGAAVGTTTAQVTKPATPTAPARQPNTQELYEAGRAAFFREDFARAKTLLQQVNRQDPRHQPTIILLKNIKMAEDEVAAKKASLEGRMRDTVLPKFEVENATVTEVLEFLQIKAGESKGMKPNFVVKLDAATEKQPITLKLSQTTVYDALRAVAAMASLDVAFDRFAVTIQPKSAAAPATTATKEK